MTYKCLYCGSLFDSVTARESHMRSCASSDKHFVLMNCGYGCGQQFPDRETMVRHMIYCTRRSPW